MVTTRKAVHKSFIWMILISLILTNFFSLNVNAESTEPLETAAITNESTQETKAESTSENTATSETTSTEDLGITRRINDPVKVTRYIKANSIIRNKPNGDVIARPWRPLRVSGTIQGAWLKFTYNKKTSYVAMVATKTKNPPMTGYAKQTLNVRNTPKGSITGKIPLGRQVKGILVGNMVKITHNGKPGYVYATLLQKNPVKVTRYIKANSIIRSKPNGDVIARPWRPLRVSGTIQGAWLKFTYNKKTSYVAMVATKTKNPPMTGYAKQTLNVRNTPKGSITGKIPLGRQVKGILVGNMVKITHNGKPGYVYATLLSSTRPSAPRYQTDGIWQADSWYTGAGSPQYFRKFLSGDEIYYFTIGSGTITAYYTLEDAKAGKNSFAQHNFTQTSTSSFQYIGKTNSSGPRTYTVKCYLLSNDWLEIIFYRKTFNYRRIE